VSGPLYLPAGPGSGKTRVLLWRTLNLIAYHHVAPDSIFLSTFTEKAALQLREGIRSLLSVLTAHTGRPYDLAKMYVGTVHSLCQRLLTDRRFQPNRDRGRSPRLLDDLDQYLFVSRTRHWKMLLEAGGFGDDATTRLNTFFGSQSQSRHEAISYCLALFNRLSEERIDPVAAAAQTVDPVFKQLLRMYRAYRELLAGTDRAALTDFSLLQRHALDLLESTPAAAKVFAHVIVDEYQDTNAIQERLFFRLAAGSRNLCVVGDDDQALYRFRGATVENFVEFPARCRHEFGVKPERIPLGTNYRSRRKIVDFFDGFMQQCDWRRRPPARGSHRVQNKEIVAARKDAGPAVAASTAAAPDAVAREIARLVRELIDQRRVENANQIAFLYPSLKSVHVERMIGALEAEHLRVYAPRARTFLEGDEATAMLGLFTQIFGRLPRGAFPGADYHNYHRWLDNAEGIASTLLAADNRLARFVGDRRSELDTATADHTLLVALATRKGWTLDDPYDIARMKRALHDCPGLSPRGRRLVASAWFERIAMRRAADGNPFPLLYVIRRATSIDWSLLDLFYRLCGFQHFVSMFDAAQRSTDPDEGPACNLALLSQYISRFMDQRAAIITGQLLQGQGFLRLFFGSYLYALFRRGESEFENAEDPFPRGRIPFLTIHQAKGLEFPVVVLGNPRKADRGPQRIEALVRSLLPPHHEGEPLDRIGEFDIMRMFYVALSRAQNLLVVAHFSGRGQSVNVPFQRLLDRTFPRIPSLHPKTIPPARPPAEPAPRNYSYTVDYLNYLRCPRQYMIFRKYDFVPSRSQTMVFGTLVHRTMDDLHQYLISRRAGA
jgi:DNA helicase-2/ATP-dependent DNA helicase PcrA